MASFVLLQLELLQEVQSAYPSLNHSVLELGLTAYARYVSHAERLSVEADIGVG